MAEETLESYKAKQKESKQYLMILLSNIALMLWLPFLSALIAWPVWNGIVAGFLHLPEVTYWQAWGILMIKNALWPPGKIPVERAI